MKIDPNITLPDFCAEMQHRVVRYPLRSIAVRSATRFAKKHQNPEFYRVATSKIHSQKLFQRELHGPGFLEKVFDYLSFGSLREVVVTLLLVALAVFSIDAGRKLFDRPERSSRFEQMDVDQLARRLGILLEDSHTPVLVTQPTQKPSLRESVHPVSEALNTAQPGISDEDVNRIVTAVLVAMQERDKSTATPSEPEVTQQLPLEATEKVEVPAVTPTASLVSSELPPSSE